MSDTPAIERSPIISESSELAISRIGIGTAQIGGMGKAISPEEGCAILRDARRKGVNYLDSALLYGGGRGLEILGHSIGQEVSKDLVISFKLGRVLVEGQDEAYLAGKKRHTDSLYFDGSEFVYDYSAEGMRRSFAQSMDHLNKGRAAAGFRQLSPEELNIVTYVHDPDVCVHGPEQPRIMKQVMDKAYPELHRMQRAGLIKAYGIGSNEVGPCLASLDDPHISLLMMAGRGTLLCNGAKGAPKQIQEDSNNLDQLAFRIGRHTRKPKLIIAAVGNSGVGYGGENYNNTKASEEVVAFREQIHTTLKTYNREHGTHIQMTDLLVQYPFHAFKDNIAAVVSGPRSGEEVEGVIDAYKTIIPDELWQALEKDGLIKSVFAARGIEPSNFKTKCHHGKNEDLTRLTSAMK